MTRATLIAPAILAAVVVASPTAKAAGPTAAQCIAAADSSIQLRDQHKLRAARAQMLLCASPTCPSAIQSECLSRVDQVNGAIPTLVFEVKDGAGNDLSAVKVDMDGQPLVDHLDGSALPLDPGDHKFTFTSAGNPVVEKEIVLHEGEKDRHESVVVGTPPVATPAPVATSPAALPAESTQTGDPGASRRTIAYVVGGVGVVGVALGAVFAGLASSSNSSSKSECSTSMCTADAYSKSVSDYNTASSDATISTVAFVAGGAAVAAGAILFFTAPKASSTTGSTWQISPSVGTTGFGLSLKGTL